MLVPIPWERYSGEEIEDVLATYICRIRANATRIRPSRGDHRIDVLEIHDDGTVTVFQIKKFACNLKRTQKRQIEESLDALLGYLEAGDHELRAWHLVLPLDPTPENLEWFYGLAPSSGCEMVWDGLTRIDGWAAQMPEVADYRLSVNNGWVMELVRLHLEALDIRRDDGRKLVMQRLATVQKILEKTDPHYRYGIRLMPEVAGEMSFEELVATSKRQPGLLMTQMIEQPAVGIVQIDVFARSDAIAKLHPIQSHITFMPDDEGERRQVEDFVNYGVPIRGCKARIVETNGPFALDMTEEDCEGVLRMLPLEPARSVPDMYLTIGDGSELALFRTARTSGEKGVQTVFSDEARVVSMTLRADYGADIMAIPGVTTKGIEGKDCSAVCDGLGFLLAANQYGEVSVLAGDAVIAVWPLRLNDDLARSIRELHRLARSVEAIAHRAHVRLPFPEIGDTTGAEHAELLSKGVLANGECVVWRWHGAPVKMTAYEEVRLEYPAIIKWLRQEKVTVAGIECDLGFSENIIVAGSMQQNVEDESFAFFPRDMDGDVCITHLLPTRLASVGMANQVYSAPYEEAVWTSALRFAEQGRRDGESLVSDIG